jgi:hypothetical protein
VITEVNVLVVFYSRHGHAEKLALAAGVGAIQSKGNIRLRRLADLADRPTIDADPVWKENLDRMNMDYVAPRPADPEWADVLVLATSADSVSELETYLRGLGSSISLARKIALPLEPDRTGRAGKPGEIHERVTACAASAGLSIAPREPPAGDALATARMWGRRAVELARAIKDGRGT